MLEVGAMRQVPVLLVPMLDLAPNCVWLLDLLRQAETKPKQGDTAPLTIGEKAVAGVFLAVIIIASNNLQH